ncbi:DUF4127 family protein [bacterium]|nr:DUF4127 family protein [bacterium]
MPRILLVPLDSRPSNTQFAQRLADIGGVELVMPARGALGGLHSGADGLELARFIADNATSCDAAIFSWDALLYGGLIQSRQPERGHHAVSAIREILATVDWSRVRGYSYATLPRLGISVSTAEQYSTHETVREYFILAEGTDSSEAADRRLSELLDQLGTDTADALLLWRRRNTANVAEAMSAAAALGLQHMHVAIEDNARQGPHLREERELKEHSLQLAAEGTPASFSFFDGADECACLLLAKAASELAGNRISQLQLSVHPKVPGADQYFGLYESRSLGDGLIALGKLLHTEYVYEDAELHWLVIHGVQPQPDYFLTPKNKYRDNPFLLPKEIVGSAPLFITDLAYCNGSNPLISQHIARMPEQWINGLVGFNTNFNALGVSAATLKMMQLGQNNLAERRFLLERLADDVVYQSMGRSQVIRYLMKQELDVLNFSGAHMLQKQECLNIARRVWLDWIEGPGIPVLERSRISNRAAHAVQFSFPWERTFEIEAMAPEVVT